MSVSLLEVIVSRRLYQNLPKANRLSSAEILARFGQRGVDLVNEVEAAALNHIAITGANQRKLRDILISGMKDKNENITSNFYTNFTQKQIQEGEYQIYLDNMFPNLKNRVDEAISFDKQNYRMSNNEYRNNAGEYPGAHAEIRALNDLAKKKFGSNFPNDDLFNAWLKNDVLGYNRNIQYGEAQQDVIMHTCAYRFHILDLVNFIRPLN